MRHPVLWGIVVLVVLPLTGIGVLATRSPELRYEDARPEIEPIEPEMVDLPGGTFMMGNPFGTPQELPVHEVEVSPFAIGKYEVTNREWKRFAEATGRYHPPNPLFAQGINYFLDRPDSPAVEMSWNDAAAYCAWLSKRTGKDYHLPTEAQWEFAARGGLDGKIYQWGDDRREGMANMNKDWNGGTMPVGSFPPNGYGIYDMMGNVNEMTNDWYSETYYAKSPRKDPLGPGGLENYLSLINPVGRSRLKGRNKVLRGGSYRATFTWEEYNPDGMHETPVQPGAREYVALHPYTHFDLGFRVALGGVWKKE